MALAGTLKDFLLEDIFQLIGLGNYNGCLVIIRSNGIKGKIYFRSGLVIHAKAGADLAENAIFSIFNWKDGEFSFEKDSVPAQETMHINWQGVILEAARLSDEAEKDAETVSTLTNAGIEITDTVESDINQPEDPATFESDSSGFSLNKNTQNSPGTPENPKPRLGGNLLGSGGTDVDEDMVNKLKSFDIDVGETSKVEKISHLEFLVISVDKLFKDLKKRMPKRFSEFVDSVDDKIREMFSAGEIKTHIIIEKNTPAIKIEKTGDDQTVPFSDMLKMTALSLEVLNQYANKNAQIKFLNIFYEEISGKARLSNQHLGYPILSMKYIIDNHRESLLTDDSLTI